MSANKILSYGRFFLMLLLAFYLILVWMYFKDNAQQLTSSGLLVWFVIIPLLLLGSIVALLWWQKKREKHDNNVPDNAITTANRNDDAKADTYQLFIYSRVCLPEGDCWAEVIDNNEDLTVLSDNLVDFDGLPILIKPITRLTDADSLPYVYGSHSDFDDSYSNSDYDDEAFEREATSTEQMTAQNSTTLRIHSLVHELLALSEDILSTLAEHFHQYHNQNDAQSNSAIHVHPDWQQHYLVSANEESTDRTMSAPSHATLTTLPIYLCLPASADSTFLIAAMKEQLIDYLIPATVFSIKPIVTDNHETISDIADDQSAYNPAKFINENLMSLSQSADPELCIMIIADSQINEEWLDSHLYTSPDTNVIPTEAGTLLVFFNKAAQHVLDIDDKVSVLLTEIGTANNPNDDNNKQHYLNHLTTIENLLTKNRLSLSATNSAEKKATKSLTAKEIEGYYKTNVALEDITITAISDINPSIQSYDISVYMRFLDAFIAHGALVNEHHLGHYMPLNNWLKSFISLSLFIDLAKENQQESEKKILVTQHKHCSMLWLADVSETSDL